MKNVTDIVDWIEQADAYSKRSIEFAEAAENCIIKAQTHCTHPAYRQAENYFFEKNYTKTCVICRKQIENIVNA